MTAIVRIVCCFFKSSAAAKSADSRQRVAAPKKNGEKSFGDIELAQKLVDPV